MSPTHADAAAIDYRGAAWAEGPGPVYDRLAEAVVGQAPVPVRGRLLVDLGAGTGAASRVVQGAGGRVVAVDLAVDMIAFDRGHRPPAAAGDARALPFADASVDGVVAAFSLTHVHPPVPGLAEAARIVRPGGFVLASSFAVGDRHPVKVAVDEAFAAHGWEAPAWYTFVKSEIEPLFGDAGTFADLGTSAGLADVDVRRVTVDSGLETAGAMVRYRMGAAQFTAFLAGLDDGARGRVHDDAVAAVGPSPEPLRPDVLVLVGRPA